jgi:ASCH domain
MAAPDYALSIRQPWATLLVHGLKTVEVRVWPTERRGRILIHASRTPDRRSEALRLVPPALVNESQLLGGIIGSADLIDCREYRTLEAFSTDRALHLNDPAWFEPPMVYGFSFANGRPLPFRRCSGWMRFFPVKEAKS